MATGIPRKQRVEIVLEEYTKDDGYIASKSRYVSSNIWEIPNRFKINNIKRMITNGKNGSQQQ
jgi:hypothetical protein